MQIGLFDLDIIKLILISSCAAFVLYFGSIFSVLHRLKLFNCPICLGFWCGLFISIYYVMYYNNIFDIERFRICLEIAVLNSVTSYFLINFGKKYDKYWQKKALPRQILPTYLGKFCLPPNLQYLPRKINITYFLI